MEGADSLEAVLRARKAQRDGEAEAPETPEAETETPTERPRI
jgi:hypothetical protein